MPVLLPSPVFRWFIPAQDGSGLVPAEGYKAKFYAAGTSTPKTIYEPDGTPYPSPSNVATLNAEGYAEIWLGAGTYKLVVTDPDDAAVYTLDNITGGGDFTSGFVDTVIATDDPPTNGLAQVNTSENHFVWCAGYWEIGDGGHGFFWNETSMAPEDGGYVIASTYDSNKRWYRVPDEDGAVRAASFGYVGTIAESFGDELLAAASYCTSYNKTLKIGAGDQATITDGNATIHIYAPNIVLEAGSMLTVEAPTTGIMLHGIVNGTPEPHFTATTAKLADTQITNMPEWWGASQGADNTAAFAKWFAALDSGQGAFILPPGIWPYNNTTAFPYPTLPFIRYGTIDATTGSDIPPGEYWPASSQIRVNQILLAGGATLTSSGVNAALVGSLAVTGDCTTTGQVIAQGSISTAGSVEAGFGAGGGFLYQRVGTSAGRAAAILRQHTEIGSATTSGTGETDLMSSSVLTDSLITNGDSVIIRASGKYTGGSGNKTVTLKLNGVSICTVTVNLTASTWCLESEIYRSGTAGFYARNVIGWDYDGTASFTQTNNTTGLAWTGSQTVKITGTASAGGVEQNTFSIDFAPNYDP